LACVANGHVSFYEVSGAGYTASGVAIANKTAAIDNLTTKGPPNCSHRRQGAHHQW
jgi:hypothetical protein